MGILKFASDSKTRIDLGDDDFLEVRDELSKGQFNNLLSRFPSDVDPEKGFTIGQATGFAESLFDALVVGWSLGPSRPSVEDYLALDSSAANVVDEKLINHFNNIAPSAKERSKSEGDSV